MPAHYNIGVDVCDKWAAREPDRLAIVHVRADGSEDAVSYGRLRETSNRLANVLRAHNIGRGDRVAIMLPQLPEVAATPHRDLQARRGGAAGRDFVRRRMRSPIACRIPAPGR